MLGFYKIMNVMEKVSLSTHSARTSNGFRMNWSYFFKHGIVLV